jgi:hypothetical protein
MDDMVEKVKCDQTLATTKMDEIKNAYLGRAKEATIAHYIETIANSMSKDFLSPLTSPTNKADQESVLTKLYQSDDSLRLQ